MTASGSAESRVQATRNRLHIPKQTAMRNDTFSPSTLPSQDKGQQTSVCHILLRTHLRLRYHLQIRSTKHLLGRVGEQFLLYGMLAHNKEGKLCLEDDDGTVELELSELVRFYLLHGIEYD